LQCGELNYLFEDGSPAEINPAMSQENNLRNSRYVANIEKDLAKRLDGVHFTRHLGYVALGVLPTFAAAFSLASIAQGRDKSAAFFMTAWLLFCALILGAIFETELLPAWIAVARGSVRWTKLMPATGATAVFGLFFTVLLSRLAQGVSPAFALMVAALAVVNLIWASRLKRMTAEGGAMLDELEGFRQFLRLVEQDRLQRLNASSAEPAAELNTCDMRSLSRCGKRGAIILLRRSS
jgi:hypothetical protein